MNLGWSEIFVIVGLALLFFGPSRLPGLGKSMGEAIRGFKKGLGGEETHPTRDVNGQQQLNHNSQNTQAQTQTGQSQTTNDKQRQS